MSKRAKIATNGGSQPVRQPKSAKRAIIEPVDECSEEFLACLGAWNEGIERMPRTPLADLKDPSRHE